MALQKQCPKCGYRNPSKVHKCRKCARKIPERVVWWVRINPGRGLKPYVKRIGYDYQAAKAHELEMKRFFARQKVIPQTQEEKEVLKLEDLWPRYLAYCMTRNRPSEIRNKRSGWEYHVKPFFDGLKLMEITPAFGGSIPRGKAFRRSP